MAGQPKRVETGCLCASGQGTHAPQVSKTAECGLGVWAGHARPTGSQNSRMWPRNLGKARTPHRHPSWPSGLPDPAIRIGHTTPHRHPLWPSGHPDVETGCLCASGQGTPHPIGTRYGRPAIRTGQTTSYKHPSWLSGHPDKTPVAIIATGVCDLTYSLSSDLVWSDTPTDSPSTMCRPLEKF